MTDRNGPRGGTGEPIRSATQRDVASLARVDRATVSRALDPGRRHLITPETVRRVESAADQLGYRPNTLAQGLRRRRTNVISLSIPRAVRHRTSDFVEGVEERLRRHDMALMVSFDDDARLLRATNGLVDGSIVIVAETDPPAWTSTAAPIVVVGFDRDREFDVLIDDLRGIEIAVAHLHRLGHRRIALLAEPESTVDGARHRREFLAATAAFDGSIAPLLSTFLPRRPSSASESCQHLLTRDDRPTAILVTDDAAAAGCYGATRLVGMRVPDDVSIVGFGDSQAASFMLPPLSSISDPMRTAGRRAAGVLVDRLEHGTPTPAVVSPHLVQRGSTASFG